jgi:molecular chaperone HscB
MPAIERPDTDNYFSFYGLPQAFDLDKTQLKTLFLEKSRVFHPDFYTNDPESQSIAMAVSAFNNKAYKLLGNDISRAQYLVDINLKETLVRPQLPQVFLMEMMELNEAIDEFGFDRDETKEQEMSADISELKAQTLADIVRFAAAALWAETQVAILKWKYMERLEARMHSLDDSL